MPCHVPVRRLASLCLVGAALLAAPATGHAAVNAQLRVEGPGATLDPGSSYATDTERVRLATRSDCSPKDRRARVPGPTALGIVQSAIHADRRYSDDLRPLRVQTFSSVPGALFTCRIGDFKNALDFSGVWLYRVNHASPEIGADQFALHPGDDVLWFFADFGASINTGKELGLRAPANAHEDVPFTVRVVAYDADGVPSAVAGAEVKGGDTPVTTNANGRAQVTVSDPGKVTLRAKHAPDIPSNRARVTVH